MSYKNTSEVNHRYNVVDFSVHFAHLLILQITSNCNMVGFGINGDRTFYKMSLYYYKFTSLSTCGQECTGGNGRGIYSISVLINDQEYAAATNNEGYEKGERSLGGSFLYRSAKKSLKLDMDDYLPFGILSVILK